MRRLTLQAATLLLGLALVVVPGAAGAESRPATAGDWLQGFTGLVEGYEQARAEGKPLLVYFYTDWCGYCRQLERELLFTPVVEKYTGQEMIKVRVNPEAGRNEQAVAARYRVSGFPALFVHPRDLSAPHRVNRITEDSRGMRLKTVEEFIETLRRAAS